MRVPLRDAPSCALKEAAAESDPHILAESDRLPADWWNLFGDPQLSDLIQMAFARNPTLQTAQANILLAAYNANLVRSSLFPILTWGGDVSRQKFSETGIIPFNPAPKQGMAPTPVTAGSNGIPVYFTQYETEVTLNYDFDVWNKNRNNWRAAIGEMRARMADEAFARLQLGIAIAETYFQLQIDYKRLEVAKQLVSNQDQFQGLVESRVQRNLDNIQAFHTANSNVASARQQQLQIEGDIAVRENQLRAYIAGNFLEQIGEVEMQPLIRVPFPQDLPLHLIAHRPDITAQLWLIESAGKQIEVAKAGFYPDFNLMAFFGYQTIHLHKLFQWPSSYYNVDPAFTLPIFDGWRLLSNLRISEVRYDLAVLQYNELVLNAARDVLNGLAVLTNSYEQYKEVKQRRMDLEKLLKLTQLRIEHNINSNLDFLVSQQNMLIALDQEVVIFGQTIQASLELIKALGGGYYDACFDEG